MLDPEMCTLVFGISRERLLLIGAGGPAREIATGRACRTGKTGLGASMCTSLLSTGPYLLGTAKAAAAKERMIN